LPLVRSAWCHRARVALCDARWQALQTRLQLDWALGSAHALALDDKLWSCASSLCLQLPHLAEITLRECKVDLLQLVGLNRQHVDARVLGQFVYPPLCRSAKQPESMLDRDACESCPLPSTHTASHPEGHVAVQVLAAAWMITHAQSLTSLDLSGLQPLISSAWPDHVVRNLATAVRTGAPTLRSLTLVAFATPIHRLRGPFYFPPEVPHSGSPPALHAFATFNFHRQDMCAADVMLMCLAGSDLTHVGEIDLSSNDFGDAGMLCLINELAPPAEAATVALTARRELFARCAEARASRQAQTPSKRSIDHPATMAQATDTEKTAREGGDAAADASVVEQQPRLLANVRWLAINDCDLSDVSMERLGGALEFGAFARIEKLSVVGNRIGDAGLDALMRATLDPYRALSSLIHLNLGSNRISDAGCMTLASVCVSAPCPSSSTSLSPSTLSETTGSLRCPTRAPTRDASRASSTSVSARIALAMPVPLRSQPPLSTALRCSC
jgi:hypothetical protein